MPATPDDLRDAVNDQPLVTLREAARILGLAPPNVHRLRKQGRMPEPVPLEGRAASGSFMLYIRSEVEELAKELKRERRRRARNDGK